MTTYISVAATRIQSWLSLTPELRLIRGASHALRVQTAPGAIPAGVLGDFSPCPAAGYVDGVVALEGSSATGERETIARLVGHLSSEMPGAEWEAWAIEADSYVSAVQRVDREAAGFSDPKPVRRYRAQPRVQDVGLIASCDGCRREPATETVAERAYGPDCLARLASRNEDLATPAHQDRWASARGNRSWPEDFEALAHVHLANELPRAANHLATIAADGNSMGRFFEVLGNESNAHQLRAGATGVVDDACEMAVSAALGNAVKACSENSMPAIIHYAGGDDIVASVHPALAWQFAVDLATTFGTYVRSQLTTLAEADGIVDRIKDDIDRLSLGVGVAFAHASYPFSDSLACAHTAQTAAKKLTQGEAGAIGWTDITADAARTHAVTTSQLDGELGPAGGPPRSEDDASTWIPVFGWSPSARQTAAEFVRDSRSAAERDERLRAWAERDSWGGSGLSLPTNLDDLGALLSRARWWPTTYREHGNDR